MNSQPWVLGLSGSHNGAAALLHGDEIAVAIQEERLTRLKRDWLYAGRSSMAVRYCLDAAGIRPDDLAAIAWSGLLPAHERSGDSDNRHPLHDVHQNPDLQLVAGSLPCTAVPHHLAHAISAFATSGFRDACVVIIDGGGSPSGDWLPTERRLLRRANGYDNREWLSVYAAEGTSLVPVEKQVLSAADWVTTSPHGGLPSFASLGGMYDAVGRYVFGGFGQAGKVMGLAPYGRVIHHPKAFYAIDKHGFRFLDKVPRLYRSHRRPPRSPLDYADLAASVQHALEEAVLAICRRARQMTGSRYLCLAGGVALNGVANERIRRELDFDDVYIMPAAEDSGVALGAAYAALWALRPHHRAARLTLDAFGRTYDNDHVASAIGTVPFITGRRSATFIEETARDLAAGKILGWFQGRAELGPRALGQRSILCDPRRPEAKAVLNANVKYREDFRPFAPVVLREKVTEWFDVDRGHDDSPFMLRVCPVRSDKRAAIPAVVHVDGTSRPQTVTAEANALLYSLLVEFERLTGVPLLLNTSFNMMGEPLVETPDEALWLLLFTRLDGCLIGDTVCTRVDPARSVLDLVPQITDAHIPSNHVLLGFPPGPPRAATGEEIRLASVAPHVLMPGLLLPLSAIDGASTGRDLLRSFRGLSETALLRSLAWLHRRRLLRFREPSTGELLASP